MSREIKFRAWDVERKRMHYHDWRDKDSQVHDLWQFVVCLTDNCELLEYTGLKDKNGKEIYEGDKLGREHFDDWVVTFKDGLFQIFNYNRPSDLYPINKYDCLEREVIGNIYENK